MKKWIIGVLVLSLSFSLTGCYKTSANENEIEEAYKTVKIISVEKKISNDTLAYSGIVRSDVEKNISFKTSGRVQEIFVEEGDLVVKGQALAKIDTTDIELQSKSLDSQLISSEKEISMNKESYDYYKDDFDKNNKLFEAGVIPKAKIDSMELNLEKVKLAYEISKESYTRLLSEKQRIDNIVTDGLIFADQDGVIDSINAEVFEYISPSQPVFVLRSNEQIVVTYVSLEDKRNIKKDLLVKINIDGMSIDGFIKYVDDSSGKQTHNYRTEISISDTGISNGAIASLEFIVGEQEGIWVPIQSIQSSTIDFVYLVKEDRAFKQAINIIEVKGDEVRVEGLVPGDKLVISGMKSLVEGMLVKASE